jgi:hypothetical protein
MILKKNTKLNSEFSRYLLGIQAARTEHSKENRVLLFFMVLRLSSSIAEQTMHKPE